MNGIRTQERAGPVHLRRTGSAFPTSVPSARRERSLVTIGAKRQGQSERKNRTSYTSHAIAVRIMVLSMVLISDLSLVLITGLAGELLTGVYPGHYRRMGGQLQQTMARISHVVLLLCVFHTVRAALPSECVDACTICSRTFSQPGRYFHPMRCSMGCAEDLKKGYTDTTEWVLCRETMREYGLWTYR
ncbi:hypothetical protein Bbelb_409490 [Branchiostoma belcheri]|nr:hypothetical protein Bbelb_409490 [Branchiostoma belcheri]